MTKILSGKIEADLKSSEEAEIRNKADSLVYSTEKAMREHGESLPEADKEPVEAALTELNSTLEGEDLDDIKQKTEALSNSSQSFFQKVYEAAAAAEGAETSADPTADDDEVVDAEIVDEEQ